MQFASSATRATHHELVQVQIQVEAVRRRQDVLRHVLHQPRIYGPRLPQPQVTL